MKKSFSFSVRVFKFDKTGKYISSRGLPRLEAGT